MSINASQPNVTFATSATAGWLLLRVLRRHFYSAIGRNPFARGCHAPTLSDEWNSVRGLYEGSHAPPLRMEADEENRVLWKTNLGDMWLPLGAEQRYVAMLGLEMRANVYPLSDGDKVILDCGANVGFFSRYAFLRGAEQVIAFEPTPRNIACLQKNFAAEISNGRFILIGKSVWDRNASLPFSSSNMANPGSHHLSEAHLGDIEVAVTSIDSVVKALGCGRIDYIKMDVEGAEIHALKGAKKTLERFHPRVCVATEHTLDLFKNSLDVIKCIGEMDSTYDYLGTEMHGYRSPSRGHVLTPYCLLFRSSYPKPALG